MTGMRQDGTDDSAYKTTTEYKPMFHEWATVQPGMICLARKKKTAVFRQYVAAETAVPVVACAACLPKSSEKDFFFAGEQLPRPYPKPYHSNTPKHLSTKTHTHTHTHTKHTSHFLSLPRKSTFLPVLHPCVSRCGPFKVRTRSR